MGEESQHTQTVVDGHQDHAARGPGLAVECNVIAAAAGIGAAVDPHRHRELGLRMADGLGGCPHVQEETVLTGRRQGFGLELLVVEGARLTSALDGWSAEGIGHADALPGLHGLGQRKAKLAYRGCRIRHALEDHHFGILGQHAAEHSPVDLDRIDWFRLGAGRQDRHQDH